MEKKTIRRFFTKNSCCDGDWKTQAAKGYKNIPPNTEVTIKEVFTNFYGIWVRVRYDGRYYDVRDADLIVETEEITILDNPCPECFTHYNNKEIKLVGKVPLVDYDMKPIDSNVWLAESVDDNTIFQLVKETDCNGFYTKETVSKLGCTALYDNWTNTTYLKCGTTTISNFK